MTPRIILAAGATGSGSTWLYNAIRYAFLNAGHAVYGVFATAYEPDVKAEVHVVKIHDFDREWAKKANHIFITQRDPRDMAASMVAKGLVADEPAALREHIRGVLDGERRWIAAGARIVPYKSLWYAPHTAVDGIMYDLGIRGDSTNTLEDLDNLKRTINTHVDHVTHFWPNHIIDGRPGSYLGRLSPGSIVAIEDIL